MKAVPRVHINGTSKLALLEQIVDACVALDDARAVLVAAAPHARDYYVQDSEAYSDAVKEHEARLEKINEVIAELRSLYAAVEVQEAR